VSTPKPDRPTPDPAPAGKPGRPPGGWTSHFDWQWVAAGVVILGVSLFLAIAQAANPDASTGLFSGPTGMAMNIGGIVAGIWVLWRSYRR
jgi:hypothetical protein